MTIRLEYARPDGDVHPFFDDPARWNPTTRCAICNKLIAEHADAAMRVRDGALLHRACGPETP